MTDQDDARPNSVHSNVVPGPIELIKQTYVLVKTETAFSTKFLAFAIVVNLFGQWANIALNGTSVWMQMLLLPVVMGVNFLVAMAISAVLIGSVGRLASGGTADRGTALEDLKRSYLKLLAMTVLMGLLFVVGFTAILLIIGLIATIAAFFDGLIYLVVVMTILVVPSVIYVFLRLALASAAVVLGQRGPLEAISESWKLSRGHLMKIFGMQLFYLPILFLLVGVSIAAGYAAGDSTVLDSTGPAGQLSVEQPPIVSAITLVTTPFLAVLSLLVTGGTTLLWRHIDGPGVYEISED